MVHGRRGEEGVTDLTQPQCLTLLQIRLKVFCLPRYDTGSTEDSQHLNFIMVGNPLCGIAFGKAFLVVLPWACRSQAEGM